jgi:hypothetical protein
MALPVIDTNQSTIGWNLAGCQGVIRYVAPKSWGWPKAITRRELDWLFSNQMKVGFVWEMDINTWRGGFTAGSNHGQSVNIALSELGVQGTPVYVAYDTAIQAFDFSLAQQYHMGFNASIGYNADLYAEGALIEFFVGKGIALRGWESMSRSFPGNQYPTAHTVLQQQYGKEIPNLPQYAYDYNAVLKDDWGQHGYAPTPEPPQPPKKGRKMFILFRVPDATTPVGRTAVYVSDGLTYEWTTADQLAALQWLGALQGLNVTIGTMTRSQLGRMIAIGDMPPT